MEILNMTRKLLIVMITFVLLLTTYACEQQTSTTTESTTSTTTTFYSQTTALTTKLIDLIPSECSSIEIIDGWVPVWCDEFKYEGGVNPLKWNHHNGGGGFGNNELQYYTNRTENLYVDGEYLTITALKESYNGYQYTSSKIWTQGIENWKYGKFEMRAKLPSGTGTWPAFWMMPQTSAYGGWPNSGEIDIMEHVGYEPNKNHGTVHTNRFWGSYGRGGSTTSLITSGQLTSIDALNEFHTYAIIWNETKIEWYFDGMLYATVAFNPRTPLQTSIDWPFDQRFYLILNLAIGGDWGGARGVDQNIFPTKFVIDYVRVYQQDYVSDDVDNPTRPTNPEIIQIMDRTAYITWKASMDDNQIKRYAIYVNNILRTYTSVNGIMLTGLKAASDNYIKIIAEDYSGKISEPLEAIITIP
jgi:beta-glucanase (GH16 family)